MSLQYQKIVDGLKHCTQYGSMCGQDCRGHWEWSEDHKSINLIDAHRDECPYGDCNTGCVITLAKDALALLKAQEFAWEELDDQITEMMQVCDQEDTRKIYQFILNYMDVQKEHIEEGVYI